MLKIPQEVKNDKSRLGIWRQIVPKDGGRFRDEDVPALQLLVYWHAVAIQAEKAAMDENGAVITVVDYGGRQQRNPALIALKEASSEIRLLSELLGITPKVADKKGELTDSKKARILEMVINDRRAHEQSASNICS